MTRAERAVVEGAILAAYGRRGDRPRGRGDLGRHPRGGAHPAGRAGRAGAQGAGRGRATARGLAERLAPFCRGTLAGLFSGRTTLTLGARLTQLRPRGPGQRAAPPGGVADRRPHLEAGQARPAPAHPLHGRGEDAPGVPGERPPGGPPLHPRPGLQPLRVERDPTPQRLHRHAGGGAGPAVARTPCCCCGRPPARARRTPGRGTASPAGTGRSWRRRPRGTASSARPWATARVQVAPSPWELELMGGPPASEATLTRTLTRPSSPWLATPGRPEVAASAAPRQSSREGPGERLAEFVVLAGMALLAVASVLPLVLVAVPVWLGLYALRARPRLARALALLCVRSRAGGHPGALRDSRRGAGRRGGGLRRRAARRRRGAGPGLAERRGRGVRLARLRPGRGALRRRPAGVCSAPWGMCCIRCSVALFQRRRSETKA